MRGNGRPNGCFGESIFFSASLRFALRHLRTLELIENLLLSIFIMFGTTVSPHDTFSAPLAHAHENLMCVNSWSYSVGKRRTQTKSPENLVTQLFMCFGLRFFLCCEGFIRHRSPEPHPRIRLAFPSSGVDLTSIRHSFDIDSTSISLFDPLSMPNRPLKGEEGEADSGVRGLCLINPSQNFVKFTLSADQPLPNNKVTLS